MGNDRSEVAQPMHRLDVDVARRRDPKWREGMPLRSPGAIAGTRRWSMLTQSGVVSGRSCRLTAVYACAITDHVSRVGGGLAGEVPGVEFLEGSVDVVRVEYDARREPFLGVYLDDVEDFDVERLGALVAA